MSRSTSTSVAVDRTACQGSLLPPSEQDAICIQATLHHAKRISSCCIACKQSEAFERALLAGDYDACTELDWPALYSQAERRLGAGNKIVHRNLSASQCQDAVVFPSARQSASTNESNVIIDDAKQIEWLKSCPAVSSKQGYDMSSIPRR